MVSWLDRLLGGVGLRAGEGKGRGVRPAPRPPVGTFKSVSLAEDVGGVHGVLDEFLRLPNRTPFGMLEVYGYLRDAIPDISDGVWTWKRLCQSGFDVEVVDAGSAVAEARAKRLLKALDRRVNGGDRGMEGLLDILYGSLFTYGAAACEIVLSRSRESIWDVVPVDVWTMRFKREQGKLQAYQVRDGQMVKLPMERFIYIGLDRDGTNPYGRSMLRSIPFVVKIQQRLIEDMAKASRNAGWSKLHVKYGGEERQRGESLEAYQARMASNLDALREGMGGLAVDQNLVTYDNVSVDVVRGDQRMSAFYGNHKAIEEQVITGMHLMPILMGRNYGSTETYGTAQYELVNRQVNAINRDMRSLLERLYGFELALMWGQADVRVRMRENRTVDVLREAHARKLEIENVLRLEEEGFVDRERADMMLGT